MNMLPAHQLQTSLVSRLSSQCSVSCSQWQWLSLISNQVSKEKRLHASRIAFLNERSPLLCYEQFIYSSPLEPSIVCSRCHSTTSVFSLCDLWKQKGRHERFASFPTILSLHYSWKQRWMMEWLRHAYHKQTFIFARYSSFKLFCFLIAPSMIWLIIGREDPLLQGLYSHFIMKWIAIKIPKTENVFHSMNLTTAQINRLGSQIDITKAINRALELKSHINEMTNDKNIGRYGDIISLLWRQFQTVFNE